MLPLAADCVYAREGVILNPHYKTMGCLYGSEYWTYTLPRRVGEDGVEDGGEICRRTRDHAQDVRHRRLLLQCLGESCLQLGVCTGNVLGASFRLRSGRTTTNSAGSALRPFA